MHERRVVDLHELAHGGAVAGGPVGGRPVTGAAQTGAAQSAGDRVERTVTAAPGHRRTGDQVEDAFDAKATGAIDKTGAAAGRLPGTGAAEGLTLFAAPAGDAGFAGAT